MSPTRVLRGGLAVLGLAALLLAGAPSLADSTGGGWQPPGGEDGAAPRTTVVIGGVSIVLIAANGKLLAFLDRLADNAPVKDAELVAAPTGGQPLPLAKAADGLLVAPFDPGQAGRHSFRVELRSADGTGQRAVELVFGAEPSAAEAPARPGLATMLGVAVLSSALGAAVALLATLWYRMLRRRPAAARPPSGQVGTV